MMKDNEMVSVIIPVYNVEQYLRRCLDSVMNQTYKNIEILLIDDGSTDSSPMICDKYSIIDSRFRVIHKTNGGVSSARNIGLDNVCGRGGYVTFIDADDCVDSKYIEYMIALIRKSGCKLATISAHYIDEDKFNLFEFKPLRDTVILIEKYRFTKWYEHHFCWGTLIHKELLQDLRFDETMTCCEDFLFYFQLIAACENIAVSETKLYYYIKKSKNSLTTSTKADCLFLSIYPLWNKLKNSIKKYPKVFKSFYGHFIINYLMLLNAFFDIDDLKSAEFKKTIDLIRRKSISLIFCGGNNKYKFKLLVACFFPHIYYKIRKRKKLKSLRDR